MNRRIPTPSCRESIVATCFMAAVLVSLFVFKTTSWDIVVKIIVVASLLIIGGFLLSLAIYYRVKEEAETTEKNNCLETSGHIFLTNLN